MNGFVEVLEQLREGQSARELGAELQALTQQCLKTGKPGTLTLTLRITPNGDDAVLLDTRSVIKAPDVARQAALFYVDEDGSLSRRDPRQPELPGLKVVGGGRD